MKLLEFHLKLTIARSPFRPFLGKVHIEIEFSMCKNRKGAKGQNYYVYFDSTFTVERVKKNKPQRLVGH